MSEAEEKNDLLVAALRIYLCEIVKLQCKLFPFNSPLNYFSVNSIHIIIIIIIIAEILLMLLRGILTTN